MIERVGGLENFVVEEKERLIPSRGYGFWSTRRSVKDSTYKLICQAPPFSPELPPTTTVSEIMRNLHSAWIEGIDWPTSVLSPNIPDICLPRKINWMFGEFVSKPVLSRIFSPIPFTVSEDSTSRTMGLPVKSWMKICILLGDSEQRERSLNFTTVPSYQCWVWNIP